MAYPGGNGAATVAGPPDGGISFEGARGVTSKRGKATTKLPVFASMTTFNSLDVACGAPGGPDEDVSIPLKVINHTRPILARCGSIATP